MPHIEVANMSGFARRAMVTLGHWILGGRRRHRLRARQAAVFIAGLAALSLAPTSQGAIWIEVGDAGDLVPSAQITRGVGDLIEIRGRLDSPADVDMFCIDIYSPANFFATTSGSPFDTQLWLFDRESFGVAFHDDMSESDRTSTLSPAFTTPRPAGHYYLTVSSSDNDARDQHDFELWQDEPRMIERSPDGISQPSPLHHWDGNGQSFGDYRILMTSTTFCAVPEPGTCAALALGAALLARRRRNR